MIDTAGRLQNRTDLMEELAKIVRVLKKKEISAPHNTLLVLDATTGQNALSQVKIFKELVDITGLVMTKLDGTAKGGVLVALADQFALPIHAIGVESNLTIYLPLIQKNSQVRCLELITNKMQNIFYEHCSMIAVTNL